MLQEIQENPEAPTRDDAATATAGAGAPAHARKPLTRKDLVAEHPTWCPGCGHFSVLATYLKLIEKRQIPHEKIVTVAGIGCSSRMPYFIQANGVHYIHGRALAFASGISLNRPDLHVFVFGGDGDGFSIGGNHTTHTARKNIKMTYVIMDNQIYGMTKKQTSPTSPLGAKTTTDTWGAVDQPINPVRQLLGAGATFIARASAANPAHLLQMLEAAHDHDGFSAIECLSECSHFNAGSFDAASPRAGGKYDLVPATHDATNPAAAFDLAGNPFPGHFGIFYNATRPSKNALEENIITAQRAKFAGKQDWEILKSTFNRMK